MNSDMDDEDKGFRHKLDLCRRTWYCTKCGRFCPNCAGRSCYKCCIKHLEPGRFFTEQELKQNPVPMEPTNASSLFHWKGSKSVTLPPNWRDQVLDGVYKPKALRRPPWPWEQPRYLPNKHFPSTYISPAEPLEMVKKDGEDEVPPHNYGVEVPPLSYHLTQYYKSTHPQYVLHY